MKSIYFQVNPVGWATCKWLRHFWRGCLWSRLNGLSLREVPHPKLPGDDWVVVRPLLGGICGTDQALLAQKQPPDSILQEFSTFPARFGHENVSVVDEVGPAVDPSWRGRRVVVDPTLCCAVRGIDPTCPRCQAEQFGCCENFGDGATGKYRIPPGTSMGYCGQFGGAFSEYFPAHVSQLVPVPDELSDEVAILTDPLACSLHAALRADLTGAKRILVYGSGVLGLGLIASLRAIGFTGHIDALDSQPYLADLAANAGASDFFRLPRAKRERFEQIACRVGGTVHRARFGNYMLSGGYDVVFDCVGSDRTFSESLKWAAGRGQVVMVATTSGGRVDLTPLWLRELTVLGIFGRQTENYDGRRINTNSLVHEFMLVGKLPVEQMLTHTFRLEEYREAFNVAMNKGEHQSVKVAFDFR